MDLTWKLHKFLPERRFYLSSSSSSSSSSLDFWSTCRYRGNIHISGPPSRQLACRMHGRSHTRSPGMSIMRVDSQELPLCNFSLSAASMSPWAFQVHAFHQPVCQRLSRLHHWSVPHVHTSGAFTPSEFYILKCLEVRTSSNIQNASALDNDF